MKSCQENNDNATNMLSNTPQAGLQTKQMNPFQYVRGVVVTIHLIFTAIVSILVLGPLTVLFIRPFSLIWYRKVASFIFGNWLAMPVWITENVNETKVIFSGEKVPAKERVLLICNHRTELDWMYLWNFALRKGRIGYVKYALKSQFRNVPFLGWVLHLLECVALDRRWDKDQFTIKAKLSTFQDPADPLWFIIFPEGTDFTEAKKIKNHAYAEEHHLSKLNHTLLPRSKGFFAALKGLRNSIDAVYDVTIGYKRRRPFLKDVLFGTGPEEVHMFVERLPLSSLPQIEEDASSWMYKRFEMKDQLLDKFYNEGYFASAIEEHGLNTYVGFLSSIFWFTSSVALVWYAITKARWLALYMVASALFLAAITYWDWLPGSIIEVLEPHTKDFAKKVFLQEEPVSTQEKSVSNQEKSVFNQE